MSEKHDDSSLLGMPKNTALAIYTGTGPYYYLRPDHSPVGAGNAVLVDDQTSLYASDSIPSAEQFVWVRSSNPEYYNITCNTNSLLSVAIGTDSNLYLETTDSSDTAQQWQTDSSAHILSVTTSGGVHYTIGFGSSGPPTPWAVAPLATGAFTWGYTEVTEDIKHGEHKHEHGEHHKHHHKHEHGEHKHEHGEKGGCGGKCKCGDKCECGDKCGCE